MSDDSYDDQIAQFLEEVARAIAEFVYEEDVPESVEDAVTVADEAEDVANYVDASDIADAVDVSKLPDAIDVGSIPDAVSGGDTTDAINLRELIAAIDFGALAASSDIRETWREGRELEEAVDEFNSTDTDDESTAADEDEDDEDEDDALMDDEAVGALAEADMEEVRLGVQSGLMEAIDEFRAGLLEVHEELNQLIEENREASKQRREDQPNSRNPTAVSTMPGGKPLGSNTILGSTVPRETRYSNAPNRERLYGKRLEEVTDD